MSSWHAMSPEHQICGPTDVQLLRLRRDDGCAAMAATAMRSKMIHFLHIY
jgi:hypothetical protein